MVEPETSPTVDSSFTPPAVPMANPVVKDHVSVLAAPALSAPKKSAAAIPALMCLII
jgi:hypothetical protein